MRGNAHVGVLKALYEGGVRPAAMSGASAGALVAAFICDGYHPEEIENILVKEQPRIGFNFWNFSSSPLTLEPLADLLRAHLRSIRIEDLKIPLHISATNLYNGAQEIITQGNLIEALTASAALPVLVQPVLINGVPYADGGISSNLPVEPFMQSPEKIIGVHVNPLPPYEMHKSFVHNLDRSVHLIMRGNVVRNISKCDLFIEPGELGHYHLLESGKAKELIDIGYNYAKQYVKLPIFENRL
jgi:NTE family protein